MAISRACVYLPTSPDGEALVSGVASKADIKIRLFASQLGLSVETHLPDDIAECGVLYVAHDEYTINEALGLADVTEVVVWGWLLPEVVLQAAQEKVLVVQGGFEADAVQVAMTAGYQTSPQDVETARVLALLEARYHAPATTSPFG